jgi:hypothetical protein
MEMYKIEYHLLDEIECGIDDVFNHVELIYLAALDINQENQYFNWFELGQMFERHKFAGHRKVVENMKKQLEDKLNNNPNATI